MKLTEISGQKLSRYAKHYILAKYDPATLVPTMDTEAVEWQLEHKGLYIGIKDSSETHILRTGFLEEDKSNVLESLNRVLEAVYSELSTKGISAKVIQTSTFYLTLVTDVIFIVNPLSWNENEDGVYFSWGDKYKGLYLPYEIKELAVKKTEIMNRLCSWVAKVPSNLWRLPEGMCSRIVADSFFWN